VLWFGTSAQATWQRVFFVFFLETPVTARNIEHWAAFSAGFFVLTAQLLRKLIAIAGSLARGIQTVAEGRRKARGALRGWREAKPPRSFLGLLRSSLRNWPHGWLHGLLDAAQRANPYNAPQHFSKQKSV